MSLIGKRIVFKGINDKSDGFEGVVVDKVSSKQDMYLVDAGEAGLIPVDCLRVTKVLSEEKETPFDVDKVCDLFYGNLKMNFGAVPEDALQRITVLMKQSILVQIKKEGEDEK